jgi:ABC-2 type transport system ATP-binding protein
MAGGRVVADGPTTEIKARVGLRLIRATLPEPTEDQLAALPGVITAERRGDAILLRCADSDTAIRALLVQYPAARDIEITGAGLEEAFLELTADPQLDPDAGPALVEAAVEATASEAGRR